MHNTLHKGPWTLLIIIACALLTAVFAHGDHGHSHVNDNVVLDPGECRSDNECAYNEECFLEMNVEKAVGLCAKPVFDEDVLMMHCKSSNDCPSQFECVGTFDKTRGVCQKKHQPGLREVVVNEEFYLGEGSTEIIRTAKRPDYDEWDLDDEDPVEDPETTLAGDFTINLGEKDGFHDDHCPMENIVPVVFDEPVVDGATDDSANPIFPHKSRQLRSSEQKRLAKMCAAVSGAAKAWQKDCNDPKVRDSYIEQKVNRTLKVVHVVFLDKHGKWPSKLMNGYKALTVEDIQRQTAELNRYYKPTGIQFSGKLITVVDDDVYHSRVLSATENPIVKQIEDNLEMKRLLPTLKLDYAGGERNGLYNRGQVYNPVKKGALINFHIFNPSFSSGKIEIEFRQCPYRHGFKCTESWRIAGVYSITGQRFTVPAIRAPTNGYLKYGFRADFKAAVVPTIESADTGYMQVPEVAERLGHKNYTDAFIVAWTKQHKGQKYRRNGFAHFPKEAYSGMVMMCPTRAASPSDDPSSTNDPSSTLPHEMGHTLGLFHTHAGHTEVYTADEKLKCDCGEHPGTRKNILNYVGDNCADTPANPRGSGRDCYADFDHCGHKAKNVKLDNLMAYSSCRHKFTLQQIGRMKCFLFNSRKLQAISGMTGDHEQINSDGTEEEGTVIVNTRTDTRAVYVVAGVILLMGVIFVAIKTVNTNTGPGDDANQYRVWVDQVQVAVDTGNSKAPVHASRNTWAVGTTQIPSS